MKYLLNFEDIRQMSIESMLSTLSNTDGITLDELKVKDLTYYNEKEIFPGIGVYLFREDKKVIYVGKCSSNSFTERIPKHFDIRKIAWMNSLLKLICKKQLLVEINDENLKRASQDAFKKLNLILINFSDRRKINRIEKLLRSCTDPLNKLKKYKEINLETIVDKY